MPCVKCKDARKHKNKPSLTVSTEAGNEYWKCHNCGWQGRLAVYEKFAKVYKHARMPESLPSMYSKEVQTFLDSKQLDAQTCMALGVYEAPGFRQIEDGVDEQGAPKYKWASSGHQEVCFPYYREGTLRNVMFRRLVHSADESKVYQMRKVHGTESCFWGLDQLDLTQATIQKEGDDHRRIEIIITEGQTDRITWVQSGYKNVISIPMGAPDPKMKNLKEKISFLTDPYVKTLFKYVTRFYIAMDNDEAGNYFKDIIAEHLGRERCFLLTYPFGYKDSNEVFAGDAKKSLDPLGRSGIDKMYTTAKAYPIRGIMTLYEVKPYLDVLRKKGLQKGFTCGEKTVDEHISLQGKRLTVVTGIPGDGKSTWVRWYLVEQCRTNLAMKWGMFSPESRPPQREYLKLMEVFSGRRGTEERVNPMTAEQLKAAEFWIAQRFILVNPTRKSYQNLTGDENATHNGLDNILQYMLYLKQTQGIFGFIIDAWNKIDHDLPKGMQEEKFISKQLDKVLDFLELHDLHAIIIAHPTKIETGRGGNNRMPTLYDIKGSSAWNEKADIGIVVYRKKYKKTNKKDEDGDDIWERDRDAPCIIKVEKMKFDELGMPGQFEMWMDKDKGDSFTTRIPARITSKAKVKLDPMDVTDAVTEVEDVGARAIIHKDDLPF